MRVRIRHLTSIACATLAAALLGASCTTAQVDGAGNLPEIDASVNDASPDRAEVDVPLPDGGGVDAQAGPSTLCGTGSCFPDQVTSCVPPVPDGGAADDPDAGTGAPDGGADESDAEAPADDAEAGAATEDAGEPIYGCRIVASGRLVSQECAPAGQGRFDAPCLSSANCAPGFACVGQGSGGLCRPFCCAGDSACGDGMFCTELPLVYPYAPGETPLLVPVCALPDQCNLAQPYPCPPELQAASQCTCKGDNACMLVTEDGTSCVKPGMGLAGDSCPCAWGHVCSQGTQKCLKLCSTSNLDPQCGAGRCTTFSGVPQGWGVCTGLDSEQP